MSSVAADPKTRRAEDAGKVVLLSCCLLAYAVFVVPLAQRGVARGVVYSTWTVQKM